MGFYYWSLSGESVQLMRGWDVVDCWIISVHFMQCRHMVRCNWCLSCNSVYCLYCWVMVYNQRGLLRQPMYSLCCWNMVISDCIHCFIPMHFM